MDDTFGATENLADFYIKIARLLSENTSAKVLTDIKETLPNLSSKGSKDDMSLAVIFDRKKIVANLKNYENWQYENLNVKISEKQKHTEKIEKEKQSKLVQYESAKAKKAEKENEITKLLAEYETLKKECEEAESGIEKLTNFLTAKNLKVNLLEDSLKTAKNELQKIENDLDFSAKDLQVSENELRKEKADLQELINKKK
jgi:chromosome segregation ATPase